MHVATKPALNKKRKKEHVCRIIFLDFHVCREGSGVNSEKRGVDERSVYWQCTSLDLMFSRQFEKHGVSRFTCFRSLLGVAAVRHAFAREKQTKRKKRNILYVVNTY